MHIKKLIISLTLPQLAGICGAFFTAASVETWYATLQKPFFTPPSWLFGPVWTLLYILMGLSIYLVWKRSATHKNAYHTQVLLFWVHLFINFLWSVVFFGLQSPIGGLAIILLLLAFILYFIWRFYTIDTRATYLLLPYAVWVSFATALNAAIVLLN